MAKLINLHLFDPVTRIPLLGPAFSKKLEKLGIQTIENLLHHYPSKYLDRATITPIHQLEPETNATVVAQVVDFKNIFTRYGKNLQQAVVADASGQIMLTWFNQTYLSRSLEIGQTFAFSGKVKIFKNKTTLTAPDFEKINPTKHLHTGRLVPVYPETAGLSSKRLRYYINQVLSQCTIQDYLPNELILEHQLITLDLALRNIHFPPTKESIVIAKNRLAFDELFLLQLEGALRRQAWSRQKTQHQISISTAKLDKFISDLPFTLTEAQKLAIDEILKDLGKSQPMNRLLEGDVGSGKTVVAATAIYASCLSGLRSVVMAPTEILAVQLYNSISKLLNPSNITTSLMTSSSKNSELANVIIGTHALLYNYDSLPNLGLVVIDEQHRFGVAQRAKLEQLGNAPHRLTMSATPIPRTVALTVYGDLDVSILDELPKDRKPIKTWVVPQVKRSNGYSWIKDQITNHNAQVFVVCPLIDPSESLKLTEVKAATVEFETLTKIFSKQRLALLHGKVKSIQKDQIISDFKNRKIDMLVATPVIEVGIDIPGASIIVIEAAERFGLAQLHQLRGRVGRGDQQSYCLLFTSKENKTESKRLQALCRYNSGFTLAEIDLKLRGPGEVFGVNQHGFDKLKLAKFNDKKLLQQTKQAAVTIISQDSDLTSHPLIKQKLVAPQQPIVSAN